ncbi:striatin-3-like isoform X3 [Biomphalaria glabrata]|uniref:Striatin-3-like isoform X3 n=1 Tax=Biomphalaria glabrata TaxID=6526 RepID=A0A2C9K794_BIOGL|nr:striatin-3-like isoform X3 [Biomphalaria glabrata]
MIEDSLGSQHSGQLGPGSGALGMVTKSQQDDGIKQRPQYSMPGILHFLQTEWARFEMERSQWEVERAELQARIAFLQGERKGQENLKQDLVRRIKMLEYALKQERAKYHKLKYGTDLNPEDLKPPSFDKENKEDQIDGEISLSTSSGTSNATWRQGRQLLRQYLQEIGYTDTIIDVRSARVRSLLGLQTQTGDSDADISQSVLVNGENQANKRDNQGKRAGLKKLSNMATDSALIDAENAVMTTFDFLNSGNVVEDDDDLSDENEDGMAADDEAEERLERKGIKLKNESNEGLDDTDPDTVEALAEFHFLETEIGGVSDVPSGGQISYARKPMMGMQDDEENIDGGLGLGELAGLTVNNEADPMNYDISAPKEVYRKTWNAKYTLRSHFDGVRALAFHPVEPVLLTASEDHTLKLWNLQKTVPAKKAASLDVEPVYTFRAHVGPVLSLAVSPSGEQCYSGGMDTTIRCWNIPKSDIDPYDSFDPNVLSDTLEAHTDAVWGLSIHSSKNQLLSCSADGTVRLWSPGNKSPLLNTFTVESEEGVPTSVDFVRCDPSQMVASYTSSNTYIFDIETGKQVLMLETKINSDSSGSNQINRVINHPTLPISITAHEDRHIRFFDNNTGKLIHSMVAHLDSVTSLAIDPNGLYLLSGSHDCSIRLWNLDSKTCVQEITSHRKKFEESIHDVAFHPQKPYIASAGADALAKVFV